MLRQHPGDLAQQPAAVKRLHLDGGDEVALALVVPLDVDHPALGALQVGGVAAVGPVDADAPAPGDKADDLVARHRRAAARQPHHQIVHALDVHAHLRPPRPRAAVLAHRGGELDLGLRAPQLLLETLHHRGGRHVALADGDVQRLEVDVVQRLGQLHHLGGALQLLHGQPGLAQRLDQLLPAAVDGVLAALAGEPLTDLGAGPRRGHVVQPVA